MERDKKTEVPIILMEDGEPLILEDGEPVRVQGDKSEGNKDER